jgi:hypothetical protein
VRGICSFALKFIIHPFEDADPDEGGLQEGGPQSRQKKRIRTYRHARKRDEYGLDNDFWQELRDKLDVEYAIPKHNRFLDKERGKGGEGKKRRVAVGGL